MRWLVLISLLPAVVAFQPERMEKEWQKHMDAGNAAFAKADYVRAEQAFTEAADIAWGWHRDHEQYPTALLKRAEAQVAQGKYVQAEHLCDQAWPKFAVLGGLDAPAVARCFNVKAQAVLELGRDAQAEKLRSLASTMRQGKEANGPQKKNPVDPNHPSVADGWTALAAEHLQKENHALANKINAKAVALLRKHFGPVHPRLAQALRQLATIQLAQGSYLEADDTYRLALRCHFAGLSDVELCAAFDQIETDRQRWYDDPRGSNGFSGEEGYLSEMMRRQGATITAYLKGKHSQLLKLRKKVDELTWPPNNLNVLTALRRVQKSAAPLEVVINGPQRWECIFPHLPAIEVALTNVDKQKLPVGIQRGGDYRSGRQERWRFEVRDSNGKRLPVKESPSSEGGGLFREVNLQHGECFDTVLNMRSFVDLLPGDYAVCIQYHDRWLIAALNSVAGLVISRSETFELHVQPRVIGVTKVERQFVQEQINQLDDKAKVLLLGGEYRGKDALEFIAPTSPAGKILKLGWKSVPVLLDELDNAKLSPGRRAWILALLYSITTWNDPRQDGVLGNHRGWDAGWSIVSGGNGKMSAFSAGWSGPYDSMGTIDETKQRTFAQRWREFRNYIVVQVK
jgi:tetratricopeptide (TPR) repeat protein